MNALSFRYEFTIYFANLLGIKYLFHNFTMEPSISRIHLIFTFYFLDSLSFFANIPRIQYLFDNVTVNPPSVSRIHYTFTFFFSNSLSFFECHYFFREFTIHFLSQSHNFAEFRIFLEANQQLKWSFWSIYTRICKTDLLNERFLKKNEKMKKM